MSPYASKFAATPACSRSTLWTIATLLLAAVVPFSTTFAAQVALNWSDNASNETGNKIERATGSGSFAQIATTAANIVSYTDTSVASSTSYSYRIRSYNSVGNSAYTNTASVTIGPASSANTAPVIVAIANRTITEDANTGAIAVTVSDAQTTAGSLVLSATSSNATLVPNSKITLGGSGGNRTITVTPAANQSGTTNIAVNVSDGALTTSRTFAVTVTAVNDMPTISALPDRTVNPGTSTGAIACTVGDVETAVTSLALTRTSSNPTLVPTSAIVLGGSGANRTVTVTPVAGQSGTATITVSVSDGSLVATDPFVLTVAAGANSAPTISSLASLALTEDATSSAIAFTVSDAQTAVGSLTVTGSSSNLTLVPNSNITFGGSGSNRTVTVKPATNQSGSATITVTVSDGALTAARSFALSVTAVNDVPTISTIANQSIATGSTAGPISFTIGDAETAAGSLTLSGTSSNMALVPNAGITFGGSGANRTVTVIPAATQTGTATITVKVGDGTTTFSRAFTLTVTAVSSTLTSSDIGAPAVAGSMTNSNGTIQIIAAGADIWGTTDQLHFARQSLTGDAEMTVRVASLVRTNGAAKAGLMFRTSLAANSANIAVFVSPDNGVFVQARALSGTTTYSTPSITGTAPEWLRLLRTGNDFYAFRSADGVTWELVEFGTMVLPTTLYGGLAVTSHSALSTTTATFDSFSVD